jgi:hypothetical protein
MKAQTGHRQQTTFWNHLDLYFSGVTQKKLFKIHALFCMALGLFLSLLPRRFFSSMANSQYDHMAHECIRLYGVLNLAIGWLIWRLRDITDGRMGQAIAEAFAVCYLLQFLVMLRAQFSNPDGHSLLHWVVALVFGGLAYSFVYIRFFKKIKFFELPGSHSS